jgi:hypothetical protein
MPVEGIISPDTVLAGGIVWQGNVWTVSHSQLSGNTAKKIATLTERLQDVLDVVTNIDDLPTDEPTHPNQGPPFATYQDKTGVQERYFYWEDRNTTYLVERPVFVEIILTTQNDPELGGNDRYTLRLRRLQ